MIYLQIILPRLPLRHNITSEAHQSMFLPLHYMDSFPIDNSFIVNLHVIPIKAGCQMQIKPITHTENLILRIIARLLEMFLRFGWRRL